MSAGQLLVVHGGAPTAVLNASLYGILTAADGRVGRVLGARGGTGGALRSDFIDLSALPSRTIELLPHTPGSLIGSSRTPLRDADIDRLVAICLEHDIRWVLFGGGNGTMDTCLRFRTASDAAAAAGQPKVIVVGVPKTIDNDLPCTDHAPGYASAARYLAGTVAEIVTDVRGLPIHVCIVEAMGRNAGWLTAAASLAAEQGCGPDLIYVPERPFGQADFLHRIAQLHASQGYAVVVVSEGLHTADGSPIVPPLFTSGRSVYYGDVAAHLAELVVTELGIKARNEKPGIAGRASIAWQSRVDCTEAIEVGRTAAEVALTGQDGVMVAIQREPGESYRPRYEAVDLAGLRLAERTLPDNFLTADGTGVTTEFRDWLAPLTGEMPPLAHLAPRF